MTADFSIALPFYGEKLVLSSQENDHKDLKFLGKVFFEIGKAGDDFDPHNFDLHCDLSKTFKTLVNKKMLTSQQIALLDVIETYLANVKKNGFGPSKELSKKHSRIIAFLENSIDQLRFGGAHSFSSLVKRTFKNVFFRGRLTPVPGSQLMDHIPKISNSGFSIVE